METDEFLDLVIADGKEIGLKMPTKSNLVIDGNMQRIGTVKDPNGTDGVYAICDNYSQYYYLKNWQTGEEKKGRFPSKKKLSAKEQKEADRIEAVIQEQLKQEKHIRGTKKAQKYWKRAKKLEPGSKEHPYLKKKKVGAYGLRVSDKGELLIPGRGKDGKIKTVQKIYYNEDGECEKRFFGGTTYKGAYFRIPGNDNNDDAPLYIAEGYATGATIHEATGGEVWIAFNADNLKAIVIAARESNEDQ